MKKIVNKQFWEEFNENKIAIHCETQDQSKDLLKLFKRQRFKWRSGRIPNETDINWDCYEEVCYEGYQGYGIGYGNIKFFRNESYEIIDFKDLVFFNEANPSKEDLLTGMIVVHKNNSKSLVLRDTAHGDIVLGETLIPLSDLRFYRKGFVFSDIDIVEVWQPKYNLNYLIKNDYDNTISLSTKDCLCLWKYVEAKKMTKLEIEEELGYKIEIIEE